MKAIWQIPAPSTAFLEGVSFKVLPKRVCTLTFRYESAESHLGACGIRFAGGEAFKCTYLTSLTVDMIQSAYDKLIDVGSSQWLDEAKAVNKRRDETPLLKHLRICFDDGPCYEFICSGFELEG